jgi:hypothetical protein
MLSCQSRTSRPRSRRAPSKVKSDQAMNKYHAVKRHSKKARGQALIIVVFAMVGLVAFTGLVVDTGLVFIGYGQLRRSVDAAALAAAAQYRKDPNPDGLSKAAREFLVLNGVSHAGATVHVCNPIFPSYHDDSLCTQPARRRLVRVDATSAVDLTFLPVVGINFVNLNATATSEAASLDIVLALDVSESMTWDSDQSDLMKDPAQCNNVPASDLTNCQPFRGIQVAAQGFVENLFPADGSNRYDRVAIIPFDRAVHPDDAVYDKPLHLSASSGLSGTDYRALIINRIRNLKVYTASGSAPTGNPLTDGSCLNPSGDLAYPADAPCRYYPPNDSEYCFEQTTGTHMPLGLEELPPDEAVFDDPFCFTLTAVGAPHTGPYVRPSTGDHYERAYDYFVCPPGVDPRYCGTTNIGEAFYEAGREFVRQPGFRQESLWVVILLTDGITNHSKGNLYCPNGIGTDCQDSSSATRHCLPADDILYEDNAFLYNLCVSEPPAGADGTVDENDYDADDYARDMAGFVGVGQQALIYTIGFGDALGHCATSPCDPTANRGEQLLSYAADIGDDGLVNAVGLHPNYFWTHDAAALDSIFTAISDRIATRLSH